MNFNKVILVGRITHIPEMKISQNGTEVVGFQLAVNRRKKDDPADFFRVVCFNKTAEFVNSYVTKGHLLLVEGEARNSVWADTSGQKHTTTEILAFNIKSLERLTQDENEENDVETEPSVEEEANYGEELENDESPF